MTNNIKLLNEAYGKVGEALSKKRRAYEPYSPLRNSGTLDTKNIYVIVTSEGNSNYPAFAFTSYEAAKKFLVDSGYDDDPMMYTITTLYEVLKDSSEAIF